MKTLVVLAFRILEGIGMAPIVLIAMPAAILSAIILVPVVYLEGLMGVEPSIDIQWSDD